MTPFLLAAAASNTPAVVLLCLAMTLGLLFYTFYFPGEGIEAPEKTRVTFLRERKDAVYENLRDLNFEYKAGKFPDSDYQQMRTALEEEAAALLAEIERLESGSDQPLLRRESPGAQASGARRKNPARKGVRQ